MRMFLGRFLGLISVYAAWVVITGGPGPRASGQDRAPGADERAERLKEMALIAHSIKVFAVDEKGNEVAAEMREEPLQRWTDPTREFSDGGMWVWRAAGRPVAVVGIELYQYWSLEFVSLSPSLVRGEYRPAGVQWKPAKAGAEFHEIADAPEPGKTESVRLRQMRELAHRFTAIERWADKGKFALRLLPHPIDRYATPASGTVDGALFLIAHGTNPEVLLLIDARRARGGARAAGGVRCHASLPRRDRARRSTQRTCLTLPDKDSGPPIVRTDSYYDVLVPRRLGEVRNRARVDKAKSKEDRPWETSLVPSAATMSTSSGDVNEVFPHKVCINLDRDLDSWRRLQAALTRHDIRGVRRRSPPSTAADWNCTATWRHSAGAYGCLLSHLPRWSATPGNGACPAC